MMQQFFKNKKLGCLELTPENFIDFDKRYVQSAVLRLSEENFSWQCGFPEYNISDTAVIHRSHPGNLDKIYNLSENAVPSYSAYFVHTSILHHWSNNYYSTAGTGESGS